MRPLSPPSVMSVVRSRSTSLTEQHSRMKHDLQESSASDPPFLRLPEELILDIMTALTLQDLHACSATCRFLSTLLSTSAIAQYIQLIQYTGVLDNPLTSTLIADRLERLRTVDRGWRTLNTLTTKRVKCPYMPSGIYDLTGGFYFLGSTDGVATPERPRGATKSINWFKLTDAIALKDQERAQPIWSSATVGEDIVDVGIKAEEHDLVSVVTISTDYHGPRFSRKVSLHLVKMSTGQPHPAARSPVIKLLETFELDGRPAIMLEVVGDMLALFLTWHGINCPTDMFYIIDWKNGCITMERPLEIACYSSFVFVSEDVIAVPRQKPFCIELYKLPSTWKTPPPPGCAPAALEVTKTLLLPEPAQSVWVTLFTCRSEPNPSTSRPFGRGCTDSFSQDPEQAVVVFHVMVRKVLMPFVWGDGGNMSFIAHRSALLALLNEEKPAKAPVDLLAHEMDDAEDAELGSVSDSDMPGLASISSEGSEGEPRDPKFVSWRKWGPRVTRWFPTDDASTSWITVSCGSRYIIAGRDSPEEGAPTHLELYDFSQNRIKKALRAVQRLTNETSHKAETQDAGARVGVWVQSAIQRGDPMEPPEAPPMPMPVDEHEMDDDDEAWEDEPDDHAYVRAGGWISEEWTLDENDSVLQRCEDAPQPGEIRLVLGEVPLPSSLARFFQEPVVTELPYIIVSKQLEHSYAGVLLEEEHLVGLVQVEDEGPIRAFDVIQVY